MGFKVADATNACRMRRRRGEGLFLAAEVLRAVLVFVALLVLLALPLAG